MPTTGILVGVGISPCAGRVPVVFAAIQDESGAGLLDETGAAVTEG